MRPKWTNKMMKQIESDESDDGFYPADDVYGATADFWGGSDDDDVADKSEHNKSKSQDVNK